MRTDTAIIVDARRLLQSAIVRLTHWEKPAAMRGPQLLCEALNRVEEARVMLREVTARAVEGRR